MDFTIHREYLSLQLLAQHGAQLPYSLTPIIHGRIHGASVLVDGYISRKRDQIAVAGV
jgi:hypothetical protein